MVESSPNVYKCTGQHKVWSRVDFVLSMVYDEGDHIFSIKYCQDVIILWDQTLHEPNLLTLKFNNTLPVRTNLGIHFAKYKLSDRTRQTQKGKKTREDCLLRKAIIPTSLRLGNVLKTALNLYIPSAMFYSVGV